MSESITCPQCGHSGEIYEFEVHNEDFEPDLVGTFCCPACDHLCAEDEA